MVVAYDLTDEGCFVTFKSPAEAIALVQNLHFQQLLYKLNNDQGINATQKKKMTLPYLVSCELAKNILDGNLISKLFDLPETTDYLQIKEILRDGYLYTNFCQTEHDLCSEQMQVRWMLYKKHFKLFMMIIAISIDGFKTDRYMTKIKDMNDKIDLATKQLLDEEQVIEKGNL